MEEILLLANRVITSKCMQGHYRSPQPCDCGNVSFLVILAKGTLFLLQGWFINSNIGYSYITTMKPWSSGDETPKQNDPTIGRIYV